MNETETTLRYTFPVWTMTEEYSFDDMRGRDAAAEYARRAAKQTYPEARVAVVSVNRGPRNYVVRVSVVR